jgi:hypothetical protein
MPSGPGQPYDSAGAILQDAIIFTNDAGGPNGLAGDILNADRAYTIPLLNERYRWLQQRLISEGVETMTKYGIIIGLPPFAGTNIRVNVTLGYEGYFDGNQVWPPPLNLPYDLIKPLELWECQTGNQVWIPMTQASDSISTRSQNSRFRIWDYEQDVVIMPGATQQNDLKIKYLCIDPDITSTASSVLVARCQTALAYLVAEQAAKMRGGLEQAMQYHADAEAAIAEIVNRSARKEVYANFQRRPFRSRNARRGRY